MRLPNDIAVIVINVERSDVMTVGVINVERSDVMTVVVINVERNDVMTDGLPSVQWAAA